MFLQNNLKKFKFFVFSYFNVKFHFAVILFINIIFFIIIHVNRSLHCYVCCLRWLSKTALLCREKRFTFTFVSLFATKRTLPLILFFIFITKLSLFTFWWVKRCTQPAPWTKPTAFSSLAVLTALLATFFNF